MDDVDSDEVPYARALETTKAHILKGSTVCADSLQSLLDTHEMFREVSDQATQNALVRGAALTASRIVLSFLMRIDTAAPPELYVLSALSHLYAEVYRHHCTITQAAWCTAVRDIFCRSCSPVPLSALSNLADSAAGRPESACGLYLSLMDVVQLAEQESSDSTCFADDQTDDGSFAEAQLRKFFKRCLQFGRKHASRAKGAGGGAADGFQQQWREMLNAMQLCANETSLEW